jgi:hypothetical protein
MSIIGKEIGKWALSASAVNTTPLLMRLLLGVVAVLVIAIFMAVFTTSIIGGLSWLGYCWLIHTGLDPLRAGAIIFLLLIALLALAIMTLCSAWRKITTITAQIGQTRSVFGQSLIGSVLGAFCDGFAAPRSPVAKSGRA